MAESENLWCGHPKEALLPCGHQRKYYYFHNGVRSATHRCIACDDPNSNTRFMQENPLTPTVVIHQSPHFFVEDFVSNWGEILPQEKKVNWRKEGF